MITRKRWTPEEDGFMRSNFAEMSCAEMAAAMGRTTRSVRHRFNELGLERPQPKPGDKIHMLEILSISLRDVRGIRMSYARVRCECGVEKEVKLSAMVSGRAKSCGCLVKVKSAENCRKRTTHQLIKHPLYSVWSGVKQRCTNPKTAGWENYGGRGITYASEWERFEAFYEWAVANGWQKGLFLDRVNNDGNYEPANCRWATRLEQNRNQRDPWLITAFGETKRAWEWLEDPRCKADDYQLLYDRIRTWEWDPERAITSPPSPHVVLTPEERKRRQAVRMKFNYQVRMGRIAKPGTCQHPGCVSSEIQAHHHLGYDPPHEFDVVWLCKDHHEEAEH